MYEVCEITNWIYEINGFSLYKWVNIDIPGVFKKYPTLLFPAKTNAAREKNPLGGRWRNLILRVRENFTGGRQCQFPTLRLNYKGIVRASFHARWPNTSNSNITTSFGKSLVILKYKISKSLRKHLVMRPLV